MKDSLMIKIVVVMLGCILLGLDGFGIYYIVNQDNIIVEEENEIEDVEDADEEEIVVEEDKEEEKSIDFNKEVQELSKLFPAAFYVFDKDIDGYVEGNVKDLSNISNETMVKLVIYNDSREKVNEVIPTSFGEKKFGPEEKVVGDSIQTRIFTHDEIKKEIGTIFGSEKANNFIFPEFISFGHLSTNVLEIYYSIDNKYYEGYAAIGNQVTFSKDVLSHSFFSDKADSKSGTLVISYKVVKNYADVVEEYYVTETFKRDIDGNYTWINIKKN